MIIVGGKIQESCLSQSVLEVHETIQTKGEIERKKKLIISTPWSELSSKSRLMYLLNIPSKVFQEKFYAFTLLKKKDTNNPKSNLILETNIEHIFSFLIKIIYIDFFIEMVFFFCC